MTDTNPKNAPVGVVDPATGQPHPNSGPSGGPAGTAQEKAQEAAGQAQAKAQEAAGQAQEKAQQAAGQARTQIKEQLDQRSTQAGERATATAGDLRSIGDQLRDQGNEAPAKLADNAALQIEKVGSYLQRTDGSSLLQDIETFARNNPWATALGGLAVGFAASRTLKASSGDRHRASTPGPAPSPAPHAGTAPVGSSIPYPGTSATGGAAAPIPVGESPSRLGNASTTPPFPSVPGGTPGVRTTPTDAPDAVTTGYSVPSSAPGQPGTATNPTDSQTGS